MRITCSRTSATASESFWKSTFFTSMTTLRFESALRASTISSIERTRSPRCSSPRKIPISSFLTSSYVIFSTLDLRISSDSFGHTRWKFPSWNIMMRPSFVVRTSTSGTPPIFHVSSREDKQFSGARSPAPRCATTVIVSRGLLRIVHSASPSAAKTQAEAVAKRAANAVAAYRKKCVMKLSP